CKLTIQRPISAAAFTDMDVVLGSVLRVGQLGNSSLVARRTGEMQLVNCASTAYLEEHGEPRTPADLDRHWAINY
ncbi:hypothetical protein ACV34O_32910, partial [Pseudomonas aeruginosa]